jgi:hypothetical protein
MPVDETDTPAAVNALFRTRMKERSGVERLRMACDMFDTAVALIVASLPPEVAAEPGARRIAVFQRMYWPERHQPSVKSAIAALRAQPAR